MKKILMILAPKNFRDVEYIVPRAFFEQKLICQITTASTESISYWRFGYEVSHSGMIDDYKNEIFDAIVFVGGLGSLDFMQNETVKNLTKTHMWAWKIVASICAAPRNFLSWWIAKNKKITWANWDNNFENLAKDSWAIPEAKSVVVDWNLITWNWPEAVEEFALAIIDKLK